MNKPLKQKVLISLFTGSLLGVFSLALLVAILEQQLPSVEVLEDIQLQVPLKIYTRDGKLLAEFGQKRRIPVELGTIPPMLINAVLATEDRRFYEHHGVDLRGLARASVYLITHGTKGQGGSTITMQVARNFFLSRHKTFARKLNEILLAIKIEKELSKERILELYLNKIYFGKSAYGVGAAAQVYFGKTVSELTLAQMATIAGLPQAPSTINPLNNPEAALKRRSHVLDRMLEYGFINQADYEAAMNEPLGATYHGRQVDVKAPYVAEMIRISLVEQYGEIIYTSGYEITTTIDSRAQQFANEALTQGLEEYDERHGWRGTLNKTVSKESLAQSNWESTLQQVPHYGESVPAIVLDVDASKASIFLSGGRYVQLPWSSMQWAARASQHSPLDLLQAGDLILVKPHKNGWKLSQSPSISGALVALSPSDGGILALVGGYDFDQSKFNRATQAQRQAGSGFKPFVYAAALEEGLTAATIINDSPVVYDDPTLEDMWRPQNDSGQFYGPTRLREALARSRNLVSIRILRMIGIDKARAFIERFGFPASSLPNSLSLALGTVELSPLMLAQGFAAFANGGFKVEPYVIATIKDMNGNLLWEATPTKVCTECESSDTQAAQTNEEPREEETTTAETEVTPAASTEETSTAKLPSEHTKAATRIMSEDIAYIMSTMLKDVIEQGTGRGAKAIGRSDIAGKTGSTNDYKDAWFTGYQSTIVASCWVGYDEYKSTEEYGARAAVPIWTQFMKNYLKNKPETPFKAPASIVTVRIDPETGLLASPGQDDAIYEVFTKDTVPSTASQGKAPKEIDEQGQEISTTGQEAIF